ncbi:hypothetical protein DL767_009434 [Monosporascus sp. MG133]|nr:hypothetical protein DL767_009434 [Monosporascus sp. MG133]
MPAKDIRKSLKKRLRSLWGDRRATWPAPSATQPAEIPSFDRGDVKQGPKTSSATAAEPCASSHSFVADANPTRPNTDARLTDSHAPPPSVPLDPRTEPAATESTEQHPVLPTNPDSPSKRYEYFKLSPGNIRLLHLMPSEKDGAPIRCQLFEYPIQKTGERADLYEALSYCWGGSDKPCSISIGDRYLPVTANLYAALLRLRHHLIGRVIWVDAICINQEDVKERGQQVRSMAEIYYKASRVIVWLGEAEAEDHDTLKAICAAGDKSSDQKMSQEAVLALLNRPCELIDMYHTYEATERHDKVFALLGMSSDDPSDVEHAGLSPDYGIPWGKLLKQLVRFFLGGQVSVYTWPNREMAIIEGKGYVLGKVSSVNEQRMPDPEHCEKVLLAACLAYRPLSLSELALVAGLPADINPRTIVEKCDFFLITRDGTVHLVRQSAKDYLEQNYRFRFQPAGLAQWHADIARRSIDAMSLMLRRNVYNLDFGFTPKDITPPNPDPVALIRYSCVFWADHLCFLNGENPECSRELTDNGKVFNDSTIRLWDTVMGVHQRTLEGHSRSVKAVAFSPDGAYPQTLKGHSRSVKAIAFSPDGKIFESASGDNTIRLWDEATGAHQQTLKGHSSTVKVIAFSPDGKIFASALGDYTIRLWDVATGVHQQTLKGHSKTVKAIGFSPDSKTFMSASGDNTIRLWDVATGAHHQTLKGHSRTVNAVAFSPDGNTLASASSDTTIRLWDTATGAYQQTLEGHGIHTRLSFSADGRCLKTNWGLLNINPDSDASDTPDVSRNRKPADDILFVDGDWISRDGKNLLWLPHDYRPRCVSVYDHTVVLGHASGQVTFIQFSAE